MRNEAELSFQGKYEGRYGMRDLAKHPFFTEWTDPKRCVKLTRNTSPGGICSAGQHICRCHRRPENGQGRSDQPGRKRQDGYKGDSGQIVVGGARTAVLFEGQFCYDRREAFRIYVPQRDNNCCDRCRAVNIRGGGAEMTVFFVT